MSGKDRYILLIYEKADYMYQMAASTCPMHNAPYYYLRHKGATSNERSEFTFLRTTKRDAFLNQVR